MFGKLFGVMMILVGIVAGLYVWGWWGVVGGIVMVVEAVKTDPVDASGIGFGVLRFMCAGLAGGIVAWCFWLVGVVCLDA